MYMILFSILVASMLICHVIAKRKGRNPVAWGVTGAVLGPLAIPIVLLLKKVK